MQILQFQIPNVELIYYYKSYNFSSNEPVLGNAKLIQTVNASTGFFTSDIIIGEISGSLDIGLIAIDYDSYGIFQGCDYQNEIGKKIIKKTKNDFHVLHHQLIDFSYSRIYLGYDKRTNCYE